MTELGGGINELEGNLLCGTSASLLEEALAEGNDTLARSHAATLDHNKVVVNFAIVGEATHGCDVLCGQIVLGRSIALWLDHGGQFLVLFLGSFDLSGFDLGLDT